MAPGQASAIEPAADASPEAPGAVARIDNPQGASPILLICEHASNALPARYGTLGLSEAERSSHIAWDLGALDVAQGLARRLDAPLVHATVSRLVLDLNREPSAPDSVTALSERTVVPGNRELQEAERERRIREVYEPFHGAVEAFMERRAATTRAVVSIHTFIRVYRDVPRPWHIGLIHDADARLAEAVWAGLGRDPSLVVGMNEPYSPADRVFHTLDRHAMRRGLAPLMIEIRNDLVRTPEDADAWAERLAPLLREALNAL